jgi:hypothetical protein
MSWYYLLVGSILEQLQSDKVYNTCSFSVLGAIREQCKIHLFDVDLQRRLRAESDTRARGENVL